jgi:hypothetical protein
METRNSFASSERRSLRRQVNELCCPVSLYNRDLDLLSPCFQIRLVVRTSLHCDKTQVFLFLFVKLRQTTATLQLLHQCDSEPSRNHRKQRRVHKETSRYIASNTYLHSQIVDQPPCPSIQIPEGISHASLITIAHFVQVFHFWRLAHLL